MCPQLWVTFVLGVATLVSTQDMALVDRVYNSLERVIKFFHDNRKDLNIDALFGIVLGQVHLQLILDGDLEECDRDRIQLLKDYTDDVFNTARSLLYGNDPKVNSFLINMTYPTRWYRDVNFENGAIDVDYEPAIWNFNVQTQEGFLAYLGSSKMTESESDDCLLEVLESGSYKTHHNCTVSQNCMELMIDNQNYDPAYGITHRLLYLQTLRSQNCELDSDMYKNKVRSYCSYIFWELKQNLDFGFIDLLDDLLLEQITLCGMEGHEEFLQRSLIERVIDIQDEHGCFTVRSIRQKRASNLIKFGCKDHTTGLGVSSLSLFFLYLIKGNDVI